MCLFVQINEHEFFRHWVADSTFEEYTQRMLCDGEWGDHVELTAMSEMYERPIEIYAYKREPYKVAPESGIAFDSHRYLCRTVLHFLALFWNTNSKCFYFDLKMMYSFVSFLFCPTPCVSFRALTVIPFPPLPITTTIRTIIPLVFPPDHQCPPGAPAHPRLIPPALALQLGRLSAARSAAAALRTG